MVWSFLVHLAPLLVQGQDNGTSVARYLEMIEKEGPSVELHFNLANKELKENDLSSAIYHYLSALKIDPLNKSVLRNLEIARSRIEDPIIEIPDFFLIQWWKGIRGFFSPNNWAFISLLFFIGICMIVYGRLYKELNISRRSLVLVLGILAIAGLGTMLLAFDGKSNLIDQKIAVVFTNEIMKSGPDLRSEDVKSLYPGYTLEIISELEGWLKVQTRDLEVGWVLPEWVKVVDIGS
jgi:hypothetical protein